MEKAAPRTSRHRLEDPADLLDILSMSTWLESSWNAPIQDDSSVVIEQWEGLGPDLDREEAHNVVPAERKGSQGGPCPRSSYTMCRTKKPQSRSMLGAWSLEGTREGLESRNRRGAVGDTSFQWQNGQTAYRRWQSSLSLTKDPPPTIARWPCGVVLVG